MIRTRTNPAFRVDDVAPLATAEPPQATETTLDTHLVHDAQEQIRAIVAEVEALAASDVPADEFFGGFLSRIVAALAGVGGVVWTRADDGAMKPAYQVNLPQGIATASHTRLLERAWQASAPPQLVPPHAGGEGQAAGNPTGFLLALAPVVVEQTAVAVVEIFQRPGGGPTTQRGYLRFLAQMCALASDFLTKRQLRQYQDRQATWQQLEAFVGAIHRRLDVRHTAFTLANDGRQLAQCDRVSVLLTSGRRPRIAAISGLDTIDRRAAAARAMEELSAAVLAARENVWFSGDSSNLPPQIDDALHQFVECSQARTVGVVPLWADPEAVGSKRRRSLGCLVVESWQQATWSDANRQRILTLALHGGSALANAQEHQSLFLLPLWKAMGKAAWLARISAIPKLLVWTSVLAGIGAALCLVERDFEVAARGKLTPCIRQEIFAKTDGVVVEVPVEHAQIVESGALLARLRNTDLEVEIATRLGRKTTIEQQIDTAQRALLNHAQLTVQEQNRIAGELLELKQTLVNLDQELALYRDKEAQLEIRAATFGQVVTWQVQDLLLGRPVERGQALLTLVDPRGEWELELLLPEKRLGHALAAEAKGVEANSLAVTFQLSTHPGQEFSGRVVEIQRRAETRGEEGNLVLVRVAIDKSQLPELHSDTTVTAKIGCGRRPLGYVLFQDVIETVQSQAVYWF